MAYDNTSHNGSTNNNNDNVYITTETTKRLIRDITDIYKNPLVDEGIYYQHDDANMLRGYAMIFGPEKTPYQYGVYLFKFDFPDNYPQSPPKLTYMTQDGKTRFNPNLYVNGKVCLSILNTWRGEGWTSCQTIRSILMTLITVLNDAPLLNEPGIKRTHISFDIYNTLITYKNFEIAINGMLSQSHIPNMFRMFFPYMKSHILNKKNEILDAMNNFKDSVKVKYVIMDFYGFRVDFYIDDVIKRFHTLMKAFDK